MTCSPSCTTTSKHLLGSLHYEMRVWSTLLACRRIDRHRVIPAAGFTTAARQFFTESLCKIFGLNASLCKARKTRANFLHRKVLMEANRFGVWEDLYVAAV